MIRLNLYICLKSTKEVLSSYGGHLIFIWITDDVKLDYLIKVVSARKLDIKLLYPFVITKYSMGETLRL